MRNAAETRSKTAEQFQQPTCKSMISSCRDMRFVMAGNHIIDTECKCNEEGVPKEFTNRPIGECSAAARLPRKICSRNDTIEPHYHGVARRIIKSINMPVTNRALLNQIHLSGESPCLTFQPHLLKANFCVACSKLINKHSPESIPDDESLLKVSTHSQS